MAVNAEYAVKIQRLRTFLRDIIEENVLNEKEENSDSELQMALEDALDYVNQGTQPTTTYTINTFPVFSILRDRAVIEVISSNMILSARNQHSYTDAGGVNLREEDVYGRYINLYNMLIARNDAAIRTFKTNANIDAAYGGESSEFQDNYYDDDRY